MTGSAIGIDVGGTKIAAGLVKFPEGKLVACDVHPTLADRGPEAILDGVVALVQSIGTKANVRAIGLAVCELVDQSGAIVSNNIITWKSADVVKRLSSIAPVTIEADVRAAALGEALFGAGKSYKNFLYITVGTGISSCLVIDGKPYTGARGLTGTFASSALPGVDQSLEDLASGAALARGATSQSAANALGAGIGLLINTLDPEAVVIGGGLGLSGGTYWETLIASTRDHIWSPVHRELPILAASSAHSAVIGAAALALQKVTRAGWARRPR